MRTRSGHRVDTRLAPCHRKGSYNSIGFAPTAEKRAARGQSESRRQLDRASGGHRDPGHCPAEISVRRWSLTTGALGHRAKKNELFNFCRVQKNLDSFPLSTSVGQSRALRQHGR